MSITLILILVIVDHWLCMYDVTKLANPLNFAIKWIYCHFSLYIAFRSIEHWSAQVRLILLHIFVHEVVHIILNSGTCASMHAIFSSRQTIGKHQYFAPKHHLSKELSSWCQFYIMMSLKPHTVFCIFMEK